MRKCLVLGSGDERTEGDKLEFPFSKQKEFEGYKPIFADYYQPNVDIKLNANEIPWKIKDNEFDGVFAGMCIEHFNPQKLVEIFSEINRVYKVGAKVIIYVPHFRRSVSVFCHLTHFKTFGYGTLDCLCDNRAGNERYLRNKFDMFESKLIMGNKKSIFPFGWLARNKPIFFENKLSWFWSPYAVRYEMIVKKDKDVKG